MSKSNQIQLSDHFTTGRLLKFTASPIIMMIFTSIYTIVDGFFVSNCAGKTAFTALNLIYPYIQMLGCLGFMIGTGGSALVAMTLGMGDEKRANQLFSMLAVATVGIGAIFSAIGLALLRPVALLLGATPELLPSCLLYGRILLTFQTAFMLQYLFQSFFIAAEKPKLGLFFTVAAGVTNMVLDSVLVGVAGLGLAGAASATVISQMVGGVAPIFYFAKRRPGCRLYFTKPLFSLRELFKACTNGHQRADDEYLDVAGRCAVQYAAAQAVRRGRRCGLRRAYVCGLCVRGGVHRLFSGHSAHCQLPLWRGQQGRIEKPAAQKCGHHCGGRCGDADFQ